MSRARPPPPAVHDDIRNATPFAVAAPHGAELLSAYHA